MRAAHIPGRQCLAGLPILLFLLLTPASHGTAIADVAAMNARPVADERTPRIVEFTIVPLEACDRDGIVQGRIGIQDAGAQPAWIEVSLTVIERVTGGEIEVDTQILRVTRSISFSLQGDFSGTFTGPIVRVRLLDATASTLQRRLRPVHLPCEEPHPGTIVTLPVTGTGSGMDQHIAPGLAAFVATIILVRVAARHGSFPRSSLVRLRGGGQARK